MRHYESDDSYGAAAMAQGNGYWFGIGILADGAGDHRYDPVAYGQGSTQHFALGVFLEGVGNDKYNARIKDEIETPAPLWEVPTTSRCRFSSKQAATTNTTHLTSPLVQASAMG
jgi:hypothetical protein